MKRRAWVIAALWAAACGVLLSPNTMDGRPVEHLPVGAKPLVHRDGTYARWWKNVEDCAGKRAQFPTVRWYVVWAPTFKVPGDSNNYIGYAFHDLWSIVVAEPYVLDSMLVGHESLHLIASPRGHDPLYYRHKCRAVVTCNVYCAAQRDTN